MKKSLLILLLPVIAYAQELPLPYLQAPLTDEVKSAMQQIIASGNLKETITIPLLSIKEIRKLNIGQQAELSRHRALLIRDYCVEELQFNPYDINIAVTPFQCENTAKRGGQTITTAQYQSFTNQQGISQLVLNKTGNLFDYSGSCIPVDTLPYEEFTVSNEEEQVIITRQGVRVIFPVHAFRLKSTDCYEVTLRIKEFLTTEDIIRSQLTTHSGTQLLETGGMISIEATCNNKNIALLKPITIKIPTTGQSKDMDLFRGHQAQDLINWTKDAGTKVYRQPIGSLVTDEPTTNVLVTTNVNEEGFLDEDVWEGEGESAFESEMDYFVMKTTKLGLINCDIFLDVPEPRELLVRTDSTNMIVRLVFKDIRSILPGYYFDNNRRDIKLSGIPNGMQATLLVFADKGKGQVRWAAQPITIGTDRIVENMAYAVSSKEEWGNYLKSLQW
ncbi:MAG: hypothetical protein KDD36_01070 [Flavobacteriales bacterium]|nr:hypothetical protein [Flavobacteriales bacterium]